MESRNDDMDKRPTVLTIANAIRKLGVNEVFESISVPLAKKLELALRSPNEKGELPANLIQSLEKELPANLRRRLIAARYTPYSGPLNFILPKMLADCTINPSEIGVGEYARVHVSIHGDEVDQIEPVPTSVILTLDESGSMENNDNYKESRKAALSVLNALRPIDEVGLITFSGNAAIRSNLTNDFASVEGIIKGLDDPDGLTNLEEAITFSNDLVKASQNGLNRIVILFTDGNPEPDPNTQEKNILNFIGTIQSNLIQFFPIAFGSSVPIALLQTLAEKTGGKFYQTSTINDLENLFNQAFETVNRKLYARDVKITESVTPDFEIRPDSFDYSISTSDEPPEFQLAMNNAKQGFYATNKLVIPSIPMLRKGRNFTFSFDVTAKNCTSNDEIRQVTTPQSYFTYSVGDGTNFKDAINVVSVKVKSCGIYFKKHFDPINQTIIIDVFNSFTDRSAYNIRVVEITGDEVEPLVGSAQPFFASTPYFPAHANDLWKVYGIEWTWFEIPAKSMMSFSVKVKLRAGDAGHHNFDNPVKINQVNIPAIIDPDGKIIFIGREGGFIEYQYWDKQGIFHAVRKDLPGYEVDDLPIKWPYK
jgi:hypothetical protein